VAVNSINILKVNNANRINQIRDPMIYEPTIYDPTLSQPNAIFTE